MDFNRIVRPFERPGTIATKRIVSTAEKIDVGPAVFTWGRAGASINAEQLDDPPPPIEFAFEVKTKKTFQETFRLSDVIRVRNSDDPNQFVDVKRPRKVKYEKREANVYPDGTEVDVTAKYSASYTENPRSDIWKTASGKEIVYYKLNSEPNEEVVQSNVASGTGE